MLYLQLVKQLPVLLPWDSMLNVYLQRQRLPIMRFLPVVVSLSLGSNHSKRSVISLTSNGYERSGGVAAVFLLFITIIRW